MDIKQLVWDAFIPTVNNFADISKIYGGVIIISSVDEILELDVGNYVIVLSACISNEFIDYWNGGLINLKTGLTIHHLIVFDDTLVHFPLYFPYSIKKISLTEENKLFNFLENIQQHKSYSFMADMSNEGKLVDIHQHKDIPKTSIKGNVIQSLTDISNYFSTVKLSKNAKKVLKGLTHAEKSDLKHFLESTPATNINEILKNLEKHPHLSISSTMDNLVFLLPEEIQKSNINTHSFQKFIEIISEKRQIFSVEKTIMVFTSYARTYGVDPNSIITQLKTKSPHNDWENSHFINLYSQNCLYRQLNLELRRFDSSLKDYSLLTEVEKSELEQFSWKSQVAVQEFWSYYIVGCLLNYTKKKRNCSLPLKRGFYVPIQYLRSYTSQFTVGKKFYWPSFTSTSLASGFGGNVNVIIDPLGSETLGIDISEISAYPGEYEVLFPPYTWFEVKKVTLNNNNLDLHVKEYSENYLDSIIFGMKNVTSSPIHQLLSSLTGKQSKQVLQRLVQENPEVEKMVMSILHEMDIIPRITTNTMDIAGKMKEGLNVEEGVFVKEALEIANSIQIATKYAMFNEPPPFVTSPNIDTIIKQVVSHQPIIDTSHLKLQLEWKLAKGQIINTAIAELPSPSSSSLEVCVGLLHEVMKDFNLTMGVLPSQQQKQQQQYLLNRDNGSVEFAKRTGRLGIASWHILSMDNVNKAVDCNVKCAGTLSDLQDEEKRFNWIISFEVGVAKFLGISPSSVIVRKLTSGSINTNFLIVNDPVTGQPAVLSAHILAQQLQKKPIPIYAGNVSITINGISEYSDVGLFNIFEICESEFTPQYNRDYSTSEYTKMGKGTTSEMRASRPFYPPVHWYRHALNVSKYGTDQKWLGMSNSPGEWPVAYHGISTSSVNPMIKGGLQGYSSDPFKAESITLNPISAQHPGSGIYCSPDVSICELKGFCKEILIPVKGGKAKFRVAFMCRVHPQFFTEHNTSNDALLAPNGTKVTWRVFDPQYIRPYGLLVKLINKMDHK